MTRNCPIPSIPMSARHDMSNAQFTRKSKMLRISSCSSRFHGDGDGVGYVPPRQTGPARGQRWVGVQGSRGRIRPISSDKGFIKVIVHRRDPWSW